MTAAYEESLARAHEQYNTIPNSVTSVAVGLTSATTPGTATSSTLTPFAGRWIWLKSRGGTITLLRGSSTVVAGVGIVLPPGVSVPFFVSADMVRGDHRLSMISDTASSYLDILSDSEAG